MKKKFPVRQLVLAFSFLPFMGTQDPYLKQSMERGKEVYATYCQSCHMENGEGVSMAFPPLAKTDYLKKNPDTLIRIVLEGQNEEITVNGEKYSTPMAPMDYLTDEQVADVYNYIRNSWDNKFGIIKPEQVKAVRERKKPGG